MSYWVFEPVLAPVFTAVGAAVLELVPVLTGVSKTADTSVEAESFLTLSPTMRLEPRSTLPVDELLSTSVKVMIATGEVTSLSTLPEVGSLTVLVMRSACK